MSIAPEQSAPHREEQDDESIQIASNLSRRKFDLPQHDPKSDQDAPSKSGGILSAVSEFDAKHPVLTRTAAATAVLVGGGAAIDALTPSPETAIVAEDSRPIEQTAILNAMEDDYDPSLRVGDPIVMEYGGPRLYGEAVARISTQPGYALNEDTILDVINKSTVGVSVYEPGDVFGVYPVDLNNDGLVEYIVKDETHLQLPETDAVEG